jgi:hypothetical protein
MHSLFLFGPPMDPSSLSRGDEPRRATCTASVGPALPIMRQWDEIALIQVNSPPGGHVAMRNPGEP